MVSVEWIYRFIREDKSNGGSLYRHCRHRLKHRKRPIGAGVRNIPDRLSIRERPPEVEKREAFGHFEFDNAYYLKENSLILSATIEGRRIETIEVNLDTLKVVQSRGVCNKNTEYHDQIVSLVNANCKLIRQRMRATA